MATIIEYHEQAELALASYAQLSLGTPNIEALKHKNVGMSSTQAQDFAEHWQVVEQYNGEVIHEYIDEFGNPQEATVQTGLSVTLFGSGGKQYLAIRGSNDPADIVTDTIDVLLLGSPERQAQYAALKDKVSDWLRDGVLQPGFTVAGHSLGGFLAGALLGDFRTQIEHAYLYNAPGVGGISANLTLAVQKLLGHSVSPIDLAKVSNLGADAGVSATAALGLSWGTPIPITIENQAPNLLANHSINYLTDALAVYDLYARTDASMTVESITALLKASSNKNADTLEAATKALGKVFLGSEPVIATGNRDALYQAYGQIKNAIGNRQNLHIVSLLSQTAADLITAATNPDALATRYALKELNSFAVLGLDYSRFNQNHELDLYNPATGQGEMTDAYLADRCAMLTWTMRANTDDITTLDGSRYGYTDGRNWQFRDETKDLTLHVRGTALGFASTTPENQVIFGKDQTDGTTETLTGGTQADRLYGGASKDILNGGAGNDYIEGNAGDDTLTGGTGNDTLLGGAGFDTYVFNSGGIVTSGDGWDWIDDADGLGAIQYDGITLGSGTIAKKAANVWQQSSGGKTFTYSLYDRTENNQTFKVLSILGPGGGLWVKRWQPGQLGITLPAALPPQPTLPRPRSPPPPRPPPGTPRTTPSSTLPARARWKSPPSSPPAAPTNSTAAKATTPCKAERATTCFRATPATTFSPAAWAATSSTAARATTNCWAVPAMKPCAPTGASPESPARCASTASAA